MNRIAAFLIGVLIATVSPAFAAPRSVKVDWRFAGWFVQNVAQFNPSTPSAVTPSSTGEVQARGAPGPATIRFFAGGGVTVSSDLGRCFKGAKVKLVPRDNSIVATFNDLSLLYAGLNTSGNNFLCVDPATGRAEGRLEMKFTGGTGRFRGASGSGIITFRGQSVIAGSNLVAETGELIGRVQLPR